MSKRRNPIHYLTESEAPPITRDYRYKGYRRRDCPAAYFIPHLFSFNWPRYSHSTWRIDAERKPSVSPRKLYRRLARRNSYVTRLRNQDLPGQHCYCLRKRGTAGKRPPGRWNFLTDAAHLSDISLKAVAPARGKRVCNSRNKVVLARVYSACIFGSRIYFYAIFRGFNDTRAAGVSIFFQIIQSLPPLPSPLSGNRSVNFNTTDFQYSSFNFLFDLSSTPSNQKQILLLSLQVGKFEFLRCYGRRNK